MEVFTRSAAILTATASALMLARKMSTMAICTAKESWGIAAALVAGSFTVVALADVVTKSGLGHGISFVYMVGIASGAAVALLQLEWPRCPCAGALLSEAATAILLLR